MHSGNIELGRRFAIAMASRWAFVCALLLFPSLASGQFRDSFESPDPKWKLAGADCGVKVEAHKRVLEESHDGSNSEQIQFVAGQGTHVYYAMPIERSPIISESSFSLWMKSNRARLQFMVRAVLPRTLDPATGKPITVLLRGDQYTEIGIWQQLKVVDLTKLISRETVVLRKQFGPHVDAREAYIDLLIINAYGGPGETTVWLDELEIIGVLDGQWADRVTPQDETGASLDPKAAKGQLVVMDQMVMLVDGRPFFLRAIEHRGEDFALLKALGFNAIVLSSPPSIEQNASAKKSELWLVAPPPDLANDPPAAARLDRVIVWQMGNKLTARQVGETQLRARELRGADATYRRPLAGNTTTDPWLYSRELELLIHHAPPLFGAWELGESAAWLKAQARNARAGSPYWVTLNVGPTEKLIEQVQLLDPAASALPVADIQQVRLATYNIISAGARGLIFKSSLRLDGEDETSQLRSMMYRLLNSELLLLEPWLAAGSLPRDVAMTDPSLRATMLQTERSRLVMLMRTPPNAQFVTPPVTNGAMIFSLAGIPPADRIFHATPDGLRTLTGPAGSTGAKIVVQEADWSANVAITQNPLVMQHLQRVSAEHRRDSVETQLRFASNMLTSTAFVAEQVRGMATPPREADAMLREANNYLQQADRALVGGDLTSCYRYTRRVEALVAQARSGWWNSVNATFPSPLSSPCCASFDTLPSHYRLAMRLRASRWTPNGLPAGDCESLERMISAGWKQHRRESADVLPQAELSQNQPHAGTTSLRLSATSQAGRELAFDSPTVWIGTGPILARRGQIARIHGFVRVPAPLQGVRAGLLIYDSFGGEELAERVRLAPAWRPFTLYRAVPQDGELSLTFALQGIGEAFLDDVTIELAEAVE